jgi:hypothetical protein
MAQSSLLIRIGKLDVRAVRSLRQVQPRGTRGAFLLRYHCKWLWSKTSDKAINDDVYNYLRADRGGCDGAGQIYRSGKTGRGELVGVVDKGDYAASYDEAASIFKLAVTKEDWLQKVRAARSPLGKVVSRKWKHAQYKTSLPGAPDGEYVVIQYDTSFDNKRSAVETITPTLDKDAQWRVSGYFIR